MIRGRPAPARKSHAANLGLLVLCLGAPACALATALNSDAASQAASQDWPAFVLVAGLLLVGVVASETGLFAAGGRRLAELRVNEMTRFSCAAVLIGATSAVLNLDTAAAFLTPVLVHMARARRHGESPVLYGALLLCNAGSLLLPGSNLTNIIVAGHLHLTGARFFLKMAPSWAVALFVTAAVVAIAFRRDLRPVQREPVTDFAESPVRSLNGAAPEEAVSGRGLWLGTLSVLATAIAVISLRNAAIPVLVVGLVAVLLAMWWKYLDLGTSARTVDVPILTGLLGVAIALGTLGRSWDGPARVLEHSGSLATAGVAAGASVILNNLPAASLLAARIPPRPYALLVGLNIGPNLLVTGSLSALLWYRAARRAGASPSIRRLTMIGVVAALLAGLCALVVLSAASIP